MGILKGPSPQKSWHLCLGMTILPLFKSLCWLRELVTNTGSAGQLYIDDMVSRKQHYTLQLPRIFSVTGAGHMAIQQYSSTICSLQHPFIICFLSKSGWNLISVGQVWYWLNHLHFLITSPSVSGFTLSWPFNLLPTVSNERRWMLFKV